MRKWIGRKKLVPRGLKGKTADRVAGIYLPTYLYSAASTTSYSATIGEDYYVTEVSRDSKGRTRVRRTRKIEHYDLALLPVWVFAIRYDERKPPIRILVNGQTGKVGGKIPTSWAIVLKIVAAAFGLLSLAALLALLAGLLR